MTSLGWISRIKKYWWCAKKFDPDAFDIRTFDPLLSMAVKTGLELIVLSLIFLNRLVQRVMNERKRAQFYAEQGKLLAIIRQRSGFHSRYLSACLEVVLYSLTA